MKSVGQDAGLLPIALGEDDVLRVEGETLGRVDGFRFIVDTSAKADDHRMLLAAAEKALPRILGEKAERLAAGAMEDLALEKGAIRWQGHELATLEIRPGQIRPLVRPVREIAALPDAARGRLIAALEGWLDRKLAPLAPLASLQAAAKEPEAGSQARALLLALIDGHGAVTRERAGIENLPKEMRPFLRRIGVTFGALDIFAPALLKPAPRQLLHALGLDRRPINEAMLPVIAATKKLPAGYRPAGTQAIRVDLAEKILRAAHDARVQAQRKDRRKKFTLDPALPISIGLEEGNIARLLGAAGFRSENPRPLPAGAFGPPRPPLWSWNPARQRKSDPRKGTPRDSSPPREGNAFAALAGLVR